MLKTTKIGGMSVKGINVKIWDGLFFLGLIANSLIYPSFAKYLFSVSILFFFFLRKWLLLDKLIIIYLIYSSFFYLPDRESEFDLIKSLLGFLSIGLVGIAGFFLTRSKK